MRTLQTTPVAQYTALATEGAAAGFIATIPMTLFMLAAHRVLPKWQHYALPPEQIVEDLTREAEIKQKMSKPQLQVSSLLSHFGYGSAVGGLYPLLTERIAVPPVLKGILYGLSVWATSYLGWLRWANSSAAAARQPWRRNLLMIVAHIIWGATLGGLSDLLSH